MKVRISTQEASAAMNFEEEEALEVFAKLNETLLSLKKKSVKAAVREPVNPVVPLEEEYQPEPKAVMPVPKKEEKEAEELPSETVKYRGFLYIKCPKCGNIKGFYMKKESDHYHCDACGARTEFEKPLSLLWVHCECGGSFKYMTNMTEPMFDINCLECGAPVAVKWNGNKHLYETIREG